MVGNMNIISDKMHHCIPQMFLLETINAISAIQYILLGIPS